MCVDFNIFYQHIVHVDWDVVNNHHINCVLAMFIFLLIYLLSSDSSCSIYCNSCCVPVYKNISSSNRSSLRNSPFIFTPLYCQTAKISLRLRYHGIPKFMTSAYGDAFVWQGIPVWQLACVCAFLPNSRSLFKNIPPNNRLICTTLFELHADISRN